MEKKNNFQMILKLLNNFLLINYQIITVFKGIRNFESNVSRELCTCLAGKRTGFRWCNCETL
jgi:hypothetical protein